GNCASADAGVQSQQQLGRLTVGPVDAEAPAEAVGLAADRGAMLSDLRDVIGAPVLGPSRSDAPAVFRLDEFDPSPIRKCLLRRIDDLDNVALGTAAGELRDGPPHVGNIAPKVREQNHLGERGGRKIRRQARTLIAIHHDGLGDPLDDIAAAGRAHQAWNSDALAAFNQDLSKSKRDHERPIQFAVARERRGKIHRRRTIGPDPDRMRRFPFLLAHIKMVVARRPPPIDSRGGLTGNKAAVLPEILARSSAAAAVQTVDHSRRDATRFENKPRHAGCERAAFAGRSGDRSTVLIYALWRARMWRR